MATDLSLLTAEAYAELPDPGCPSELVEGEIVLSPPPSFRHGDVCAQVSWLLKNHVNQRKLGRVLTNDSGVITRRDPDTVRGADVAYYSYTAVPRDATPRVWASVPPELVFEVRSPSDRWATVNEKVAEYLAVGVRVVCVVDYESSSVVVHYADRLPQTLGAADTLTLAAVLPDFSVTVGEFFE